MLETPIAMPRVLAVDLDGTLLRSNLLHETFWSAFSSDWRTPFAALRQSLGGRAPVKKMLADASNVDLASLPYDEEVLALVRQWRADGGRTALVTAADQTLADGIAQQLGLFDEAFGSNGSRRLKGRNRARFLVDHYGQGQFAYLGDAGADVAVWRESGHAIVRNPSSRVRSRASAAQPSISYLGDARESAFGALASALRPHQWLKNVLVFLPVLGAHHFDGATLLHAVMAFVAFSLIASSVYLLNDLLDLSADRAHPRKRNRPFASGAARLEHGLPATLLLLATGTGISALLGPWFLLVMLVYFATTTAYSLVLKRQPMLDICTLAALYTVRVLAGGVATGIPLSMWMLVFSLFFFFSLASVKRQAELVDAAKANKLKIHGRGYHPDDLPLVAQMATASGYVSVMIMALYVNSEAVTRLYRHPEALWGITLVLLFWISRMTFTAHRGQMHDDPVVFAARDRVSLACGALIFGFALVGASG